MSASAVLENRTGNSSTTSSTSITHNITHIKPIPIDLTKAQVEYPVSPRKLNDGPKINIYVGEAPALDQVFNGFPSSVLAHFCPALRRSLHSMKWAENYIVVLPDLCKPAVGWFLRFALAGGQFVVRKSESKESAEFVHRLHAMLTLGFDGRMTKLFWKRLITEVQLAAVKWDQIEWLYFDNASGITVDYSMALVQDIAYAMIHGKMTDHKHLQGCLSNQLFYSSMRDIILTMNGIIARRQMGEKIPLSIHQVEFIFDFTIPGERTREVLCDGLARLMVDGLVTKGSEYIEFSRHNDDFLRTITLLGEQYQEHKKIDLKIRECTKTPTRRDMKFHRRISTTDSIVKPMNASDMKQLEARPSNGENKGDTLAPEPHNLNVFPALPTVAQPNLRMETAHVPRITLPLEDRKAEKHDKEIENSLKAAEKEESGVEPSKLVIPKPYPLLILGSRRERESKMFTLGEAAGSTRKAFKRPDILRYEARGSKSESNIPSQHTSSQFSSTSDLSVPGRANDKITAPARLNHCDTYVAIFNKPSGKQRLDPYQNTAKDLTMDESLATDDLVEDLKKLKPIPRVKLPKADQYHDQFTKNIAPTHKKLVQAQWNGLYDSIYASQRTKETIKACRHTAQNPFPRPNIPSATALKPRQITSDSKNSSSLTSSGEGGGIPVSPSMTKAHNPESVQRIANWLERTNFESANSHRSAGSSEDSSGGGVDLQKKSTDGSRRTRGKRGGRYKRVWNKETKIWDKVLKGPEDYELKQNRGRQGKENLNRRVGNDASGPKGHINRSASNHGKICDRKVTGGVQFGSRATHMSITWD